MIRISAVAASILAYSCGPAEPTSKSKFSAGEHTIIGDMGYGKACDKRNDCLAKFFRADGAEDFSYGELVAFSGDFYESAEELFKEQKQPWYKPLQNNVGGNKKLFQQEVEAALSMMDGHSTGEYPDFSHFFAMNYTNYLSLAEHNAKHFGFNNIRQYVTEHTKALSLAAKARSLKAEQPQVAQETFRQAIFQNAFADHFLTDSFASGHIRNPRQQTMEWAESRGLPIRTAAALNKVLHDRDGEMRQSGEHGLPVRNARGDEWFARCDAQLFFKNNLDTPAVAMVTEAVELSLDEIFSAYDSGDVNSGIFTATQLVPFPDDESISLVDTVKIGRFEPKTVYDTLAWYFRTPFVKDFSPALIGTFYQALPEIMEKMRSDVQTTVAAEPELRQRLPAEYLQAFAEIH